MKQCSRHWRQCMKSIMMEVSRGWNCQMRNFIVVEIWRCLTLPNLSELCCISLKSLSCMNCWFHSIIRKQTPRGEATQVWCCKHPHVQNFSQPNSDLGKSLKPCLGGSVLRVSKSKTHSNSCFLLLIQYFKWSIGELVSTAMLLLNYHNMLQIFQVTNINDTLTRFLWLGQIHI